MHILSAILAIPKVQFFLATNLLLQTVAAIHPEFHLLFKRQGCYRIESECLTVGSDPRECINYICDNCAALDDAISTCCQLTGDLNKAQCMSDNIDTDSPSNSDDDDSDSDSDSPSLTASSGSSGTASPNAGCSSLADILTSCDSATPGFEYITAWRGLASCYCYSASAFAPQSFDNPYSSCLSYLETADTELYSSLTVGIEVSTPCASIGNVLAESTGEAETTVSRTARPGPTPTTGGGSGPTATSGSSGGSSGDNEETSGASDSPGPGVGDSPVGASGHIGVSVFHGI
ncbi:MAG: hypothetical protein LQ337_003581 [Flavoplaca oasis]|nr:MAG: hypothetical protein LQ337_003581 [Flavoplaca oasis]